MAIDFPNSPSVNDTFTADGRTWKWNGSAWIFLGLPGPEGPQGPQGIQGETGPAGADGVGVPVGGTTGQVLSKASGTNYDTQWTTPSTGITTGKAIAMAMVFG